ncbi:hypothetical protein DL771_011613 [Monosporascus sp. 5C6A]|nr:hypothetical protein DL771_011613 [Monosporascus sp. 5C6A]
MLHGSRDYGASLTSAEALAPRKWIRTETYHDYKNLAFAFPAGTLTGHAASELLYEVIREANLASDTFYKNEEHIACLFKDNEFFLDTEGSLPFDLILDQPGSTSFTY